MISRFAYFAFLFSAMWLSFVRNALALATDSESKIASAVHAPTGNWLYDFQALVGTLVAFLALIATFLISERNRKQDWEKFEAAQRFEKEKLDKQKSAFYSILREDLSLLKEDVEDQVKVFRDLCKEMSEPRFSASITPEHINRAMIASQPKVGAALIGDLKTVEYLGDATAAQYLERVNKFLKSLEDAIEWCRDAILDMQAKKAFDDVEDVQNYVEARKSRLFAAIEQLRSVIVSALLVVIR